MQLCEGGINGYGAESDCGFSNKILIKGGTVVNAYHQEVADVYVEDGLILAVKPNIMVVVVVVVVVCLLSCTVRTSIVSLCFSPLEILAFKSWGCVHVCFISF